MFKEVKIKKQCSVKWRSYPQVGALVSPDLRPASVQRRTRHCEPAETERESDEDVDGYIGTPETISPGRRRVHCTCANHTPPHTQLLADKRTCTPGGFIRSSVCRQTQLCEAREPSAAAQTLRRLIYQRIKKKNSREGDTVSERRVLSSERVERRIKSVHLLIYWISTADFIDLNEH